MSDPLKMLPLLLFMLGIGADHPDYPLAADNLAVFTDAPDTGSYFHDKSRFTSVPGFGAAESGIVRKTRISSTSLREPI